MSLHIGPQPSCARAWIAAASAVAPAGEAYNVIIDVTDPTLIEDKDNRVIGHVDSFLREYGQAPISTIANTIFPRSLYRTYGSPAFFGEYNKAYEALTDSKRWGRYFARITSHKDIDGKEFNPLQELIDKINEQKAGGSIFKATHELAIYDPARDRKYRRGGQCLSFISFKVHPTNGLMQTAMYRNHTYITRCLGNLIGLGRLQAFIAKETGLKVGSLTCISTHAEIDKGEGNGKRWGLTDGRLLIDTCKLLLNVEPTAAEAAPSA